MDSDFERPSAWKLICRITRIASWSLAANVALFGLAAFSSRAPSTWFEAAAHALPSDFCHGFLCTADSIRSSIWMLFAVLASIVDLVLHYRSVHRASSDFRYVARYSLGMAMKVIGLDTRGAESDKARAIRILEGTQAVCIKGFLVQLVWSLPLFVVSSIGPWVTLSRLLMLEPCLVASFVLLKSPAITLAIVELSALAFRTWSCHAIG